MLLVSFELNLRGRNPREWGARPGFVGSFSVARPTGVAVSPDGRLVYVAGVQGLFAFTPEGAFVRRFALPPDLVPLYVAVTPEGDLLVTDGHHRGLYRFSPSGVFLGRVKPPDGDWAPLAVSVAPDGRILVTSALPGRHRVLVLAGDGTLLLGVGKEGQGPGEFEYPNGVALRQGLLYVADSGNARLQVLTADGQPLQEVREAPDGRALNMPLGLAVHGDRLFLVDRTLGAVLVYLLGREDPEPLYALGEEGRGPGQFLQPAGIALGPDGTIYVADSGNDRVQIWR